MRKKLAVLGSTGFIGTSTLKIAKHLGAEVVALCAKSKIDLLEAQAKQFNPKLIAVYDEGPARLLQKRLPHIPVLSGPDGLKAAASLAEADFIMIAVTGSCGILPTIAALNAGKEIGLATKEVLVSAGELIASLVKEKKGRMIPIDSEHSAIFQCLKGEKIENVRRLILTASGGPLVHKTAKELEKVTFDEALSHPNFKMGPKVAVDCSTLMNKGLEMIEAQWLYGIEPEKVEAVIHPQQRVHSFVEFIDGTMLAQIGEPDMLLPIQYAITYPERKEGLFAPFDFIKNGMLSFQSPDYEKFLCLKLSHQAMLAGRSYPCFLNAANEVLVERFLKKKISWKEIGQKLEKLISSHDPENLLTLESILETHARAREKAGVI
jgi:1-deoxy-D-xylulose-5-phosphate reductoisomerase